MKTILTGALAIMGCLGLSVHVADATPSTTYWTPMTLDIQSFGIVHIGVDNYFTIAKRSQDGAGGFPTDAGLTLGILPFTKVQMEIGVDYLGPSDEPFYFNAKLGAPEGTLFRGAPALQAGIFNVGTRKGVTNQNIGHVVVGKTLPLIGRVSAGPYLGNGDVLRDADGNKANSGVMVALDHAFATVRGGDGGEFSRWVVAADYASGRNALGGGGFGVYYFFTKSVSLLVGPVWFNEERINGRWKWTIQLDINHPRVFGRK